MAEVAGQYWICSCYFSRNIFLHEYKLHVSFEEEAQFKEQYRDLLKETGCDTEERFQEVLTNVKAEITRRKRRGQDHVHRSQLVKEKYHCLHPALYTLSESFLDPKFLEVVEYCKAPRASADGLLELIDEENAPNVFTFPVFNDAFCAQFMEEIDHFEHSDIPKGRPNSMNKNGILLSELHFDRGFMDTFRLDYLMPIARLLYPEWVGKGLDSHRAFIVKYAIGEDLDLSYHFDNAEVTLNVCLGKRFTGGTLYFGPMKGEHAELQADHIYEHVIGQGLLHRGRHKHGANPITEGERYNLIVWMRSSSVRNQLCPMCDELPKLVPNEGFGDGFTIEEDQKTINACNVI